MAKYNLTEIKDKDASYRLLIRAELLDELYEQVFQRIIVERKYRDPEYSAKRLAQEIQTNTRYISAVVSMRFGKNYSSLVNEYRIKDVLAMLIDRRYAECTIEELSAMVGFANRQSFYAAFYKFTGMTPKEYKLKHSPVAHKADTAKKTARKKATKD